MLTPLDEKTTLARRIDRIVFKLTLLIFSLGIGLYFYLRPLPALIGGTALYIVLLIMLVYWDRMSLKHKEAALRSRIGGALAIEALSLLPQDEADAACADLLSHLSSLAILATDANGTMCRYNNQAVLIRCDVQAPGDLSSCRAVLYAQRACIAAQAERVVLCTTTHFDARAQQLAEQISPPIRLIDSAVLSGVCGRLHPATDEQLAALGKRKRSPFSWPRLKIHVFASGKKRRYLTYAFALLILFLLTDRLYYLIPALLCYLLALGTHRSAKQPFRL